MTRRSYRSPDRAPRGRRARLARAPSIATPRRPDPWPPPPRCAPSRLPAAPGARAARRAGSRRRRSGSKMRSSSSAGEIDLEIGDERANRIELSGLGQRGFCARRQVWPARQRRLEHDVSARDAIDEVGVGQHGRVLKHRRRPLPARPPPARGSKRAARRGPCTKLPPAPGAPDRRDRRAARSSPAPLRRARMRGDRSRDRRVRARSPLAPARPSSADCTQARNRRTMSGLAQDGAGKSSVIGRLACMSASLAGHGGRR